MTKLLSCLVALAALAPPAAAQSEAALKGRYEGRMVTVKLDMPATENGVDVYPGTERPLDYAQYATRLKRDGTAIRAGERVMVTKVKVKGKLIEFQLGGGGYGTFGDQTNPDVSVGSVPKTKREQDLERDVKGEQDPVVKRRMQQELDALRNDREREDRRNRAATADATERRRAYIAERRLQGGSRFNVRYRDGVPAGALAPEAFEAALAAYVDFNARAEPARPPLGSDVRKGMPIETVDSLLGAPAERTERMEGTLRVSTRVYERGSERLIGDFVEGVLVRVSGSGAGPR
jgi:hypothetical protein